MNSLRGSIVCAALISAGAMLSALLMHMTNLPRELCYLVGVLLTLLSVVPFEKAKQAYTLESKQSIQG